MLESFAWADSVFAYVFAIGVLYLLIHTTAARVRRTLDTLFERRHLTDEEAEVDPDP